MVNFGIIGSGSNANSYIFENNDFSFVIDNGFSYKEFEKRCKDLKFDIKKIKYVFLTHTHTDHKKGIWPLIQKLNIPLIFHEKINDIDITRKPITKKINFKWDIKYKVKNGFSFIPFKIFHDVPYPSGFYFSFDKYKFSLISDTGKYNKKMLNFGLNSNFIFLESNYDPDLLKNGSYPDYLKKRIKSDLGHLSNLQSLDFINNMAKYLIECNQKLQSTVVKEIYLCHLSDNNNSLEIIKNTIVNGLLKNYKNIQSKVLFYSNGNFYNFEYKNSIFKFNITVIPKNEKIKRKLP